MPAAHDEPGARDPLMAALTDAPLSDEERADPAFMAEHRSATADLTHLRSRLHTLAETLISEALTPADAGTEGAAEPTEPRVEDLATSAGPPAEGPAASPGRRGAELAATADARVEGAAGPADTRVEGMPASADARAGQSAASAGARGEGSAALDGALDASVERAAGSADARVEGTPGAGGGAGEPAGAGPGSVVPLRRSRRRLLGVALRGVGVAAAGVLVVGAGLLVARIGADGASDLGAGADEKGVQASSGAGADYGEAYGGPLGDPAYLACARTVVEGDVTDVRAAGADDQRVTLRVTRSYKPETAAAGVYLDIILPRDLDPLLAEGDHVLVGLSPGSASPDVWAVGESDIARERSSLGRALPQAERRTCETGE
ncbi:hypothetical protein [Streptomyces sp. NPDC018693]|uniref:hypothetical protein n=1 Tax=unclassified Streptomyces TaxID=2593676 RepID=UPI0037B55F3A